MDKLKAILHVIWMVLLPLLIINVIYYLIGAIIAWDLNPMKWWIFNHWVGRTIIVILELAAIVNAPKFWDDY